MVTYKYGANDSTTFSDNYISYIYEDRHHTLWIGAINEDSAGNLWIGTDDGGLNRLQQSTGAFVQYLNNEEKIRACAFYS